MERKLHKSLKELVLSRDLITAKPNDTVGETLEKMRAAKCGSVVICSHKKPVGIFTERDLLRKLSLNDPLLFLSSPLLEVMTSPLVTVKVTRSILGALSTMRLGNFRHLPVVGEKGNLVGVVSLKDIMDYILDCAVDVEEELMVR